MIVSKSGWLNGRSYLYTMIIKKLFRTSLFTLFIIGLQVSKVTAQDTLVLLNGDLFVAHIVAENEYEIEFSSYYSKSGILKSKPGLVDKMRVYSIIDSTGQERIVYEMDTLLGNDLSKEQMYNYILGERHANDYYTNGRWWLAGGIVGGIGLVLFDTYGTRTTYDDQGNATQQTGMFHQDPSIAPIFFAFAYPVTAGLLKVNLNTSTVDDRALLLDEAFLSGYERSAKKKRLFSSLYGSLSGVAAGFLTYLIFRPNL